MEPTLMVIGVDQHTAPPSLRDRFLLSEKRRYEALRRLSMAEGIDEIVVLSADCRTEFLVWAGEPTLAANSVLQFLGSEYGLKLTEWQDFYRLLDNAALTHIFRLAAGIESSVTGELEITPQIKSAWEQARAVGAVGPFLNSILERALAVCAQVRTNLAVNSAAISNVEKFVNAEALAFRGRFAVRSAATDVAALRRSLEQICRQELDSYIEESGPFKREQEESLHAITAQIIQRIAGSLARQLKELPEKEEQEQMIALVTRLFRLKSPKRALAGTRSEEKSERIEEPACAVQS